MASQQDTHGYQSNGPTEHITHTGCGQMTMRKLRTMVLVQMCGRYRAQAWICGVFKYYSLTDSQPTKLETYIETDAHWTFTNTCAAWASACIWEVVGEDVDADGLLGFESPSEIGESILALEAGDPTGSLAPNATDLNAPGATTSGGAANSSILTGIGSSAAGSGIYAIGGSSIAGGSLAGGSSLIVSGAGSSIAGSSSSVSGSSVAAGELVVGSAESLVEEYLAWLEY